MTVGEIKATVMHQTNNDASDLEDFAPFLNDYINDGYDKMLMAYASEHAGSENYPALLSDEDEPDLPDWWHNALADWATWLVYRNGNAAKQQRGYVFRTAFEEALAQIKAEGGKHGVVRYFINIPK